MYVKVCLNLKTVTKSINGKKSNQIEFDAESNQLVFLSGESPITDTNRDSLSGSVFRSCRLL